MKKWMQSAELAFFFFRYFDMLSEESLVLLEL